jgi:hypothetical protein
MRSLRRESPSAPPPPVAMAEPAPQQAPMEQPVETQAALSKGIGGPLGILGAVVGAAAGAVASGVDALRGRASGVRAYDGSHAKSKKMDSSRDDREMSKEESRSRRSTRPADGLASEQSIDDLLKSTLEEKSAVPAKPKPAQEFLDAGDLDRKTTVRYFSQMNPFRNFPYLVIVSKMEIEKVVARHVAQVSSKKSFKIDRRDPYVTIRPILPGCLVVPAEKKINVVPELVETRFFVTPQVEGDIGEASCEILYQGKVLDTVMTPTRVTKQTLAKAAAAFSFGAPFIGSVFNEQLAKGFPMFADFSRVVGGVDSMSWLIGGASLLAAGTHSLKMLAFCFFTRPILL